MDPLVLAGHVVRLDPLSATDVAELVSAASEDRSHYGLTRVPADLEAMHAYVQLALGEAASGISLPLVVRSSDTGRVIGTTRFLDLAYWRAQPEDGCGACPSVAEIGSTWFAASAQRTGANTQTKILMLDYAFEVWHSYRVSFQTDARNERSRAAIERIGATFEGVRRAHKQAADGGIRDTAFFSILRPEWPAARRRLTERLARYSS
jgi:RimJ/RimL family protein N-acetyltransferase